MRKIIIKLIEDYKDDLEKAATELLAQPDGSFIKRGKFHYNVINKKQIGITKNKKLKRKLCRKKYLLFRKKELSKNISILEHALSKIHEATDKEAVNSFTGAYREMPDDYFYHPSMEKWLAESSKENLYRKEGLKCTSNKGTKLRSKSEVFIANKLEFYNLFYWYEAKIKVKDETVYPDFAIINPYTGKVILWEHFGALHLDGYAKKMIEKMDKYLKLGYIPFETIIYTFEPDVLDPERLKFLIENIILN